MYILGAPPSKQTSKKKSSNFEIYCMLLCYSFSAVTARSFEWLTNGKSLIKTKLNRWIELNWNQQRLLSSAINNKGRETWKLRCENAQWNVQYIIHESTQWSVKYMVHESYMENTVEVCWCQNNLTHLMVLVHIHTSLHFEHFIS